MSELEYAEKLYKENGYSINESMKFLESTDGEYELSIMFSDGTYFEWIISNDSYLDIAVCLINVASKGDEFVYWGNYEVKCVHKNGKVVELEYLGYE